MAPKAKPKAQSTGFGGREFKPREMENPFVHGDTFDDHAKQFKELTGKNHSDVGHERMYKTLVDKAGFTKTAVITGMIDDMRRANELRIETVWHQSNAHGRIGDVLKKCGFKPSKAELTKAVKLLPKVAPAAAFKFEKAKLNPVRRPPKRL